MKEIIYTPHAPEPLGPYSQAILAGNTLYVSGQIPINPTTNTLVKESIEEQTHQVMKNLKAVLETADMNFDNVVKVSIFLSDINSFSKVNEVYASYFDEKIAPARETMEVANLPKLVDVEISCIAVK